MSGNLPETPEEWRDRHVRIAETNLGILRKSGLRFEVRETRDGLLGASALFRDPGKPRVDFFLSTGRWRVVGAGKQRLHRGMALGFLTWYRQQKVGEAP